MDRSQVVFPKRRRRRFQFTIAEMLGITFVVSVFFALRAHLPLVLAVSIFMVLSPLVVLMAVVVVDLVHGIENWLLNRARIREARADDLDSENLPTTTELTQKESSHTSV